MRLPDSVALLVIDVQRAIDHPSWGERNNPGPEANIEIRSVRPNERFHLRINPHLIEQLEIAQAAVQFARQDGLKIDGPFRGVVETDTECVRTNDIERLDSINGVTHKRLL
jgi:hypothetical protein